MKIEIPTDIWGHLEELLIASPGIREIWLLGSRINGDARVDSDWDLLFFADSALANHLNSDSSLLRGDIDYLVLVDDESILRISASGSGELALKDFTGLDWKLDGQSGATYIARGKRELAIDPMTRSKARKRAVRIYPWSEDAAFRKKR